MSDLSIKYNPDKRFFSMEEMSQPVNQWLGIAFISLICFWVVLYYLTQRTQALGDTYVRDVTKVLIETDEIRVPSDVNKFLN